MRPPVSVKRETSETTIEVTLGLDGTGVRAQALEDAVEAEVEIRADRGIGVAEVDHPVADLTVVDLHERRVVIDAPLERDGDDLYPYRATHIRADVRNGRQCRE